MRKPVIVSIVMPKGGTGKSTFTVNLALAAMQDGWTPLIIDTDPQVSSCKWADRRGKGNPPHVIDAMPARLRQAIEKAQTMGIDFFIIDTPPLSGEAGVAAARLADLVISPCGIGDKDIEALDKLTDDLKVAGNPECLVILSQTPHISFARRQWARNAIENKGFQVCTTEITNLVAFMDADKTGSTVLEFEPEGRAAGEIRQAYKQISQLIGNLASRGAEHGQLQSRRAV